MMLIALAILSSLQLEKHLVRAEPKIPNFPTACYGREGDLNIAVLSATTRSAKTGQQFCTDEIHSFYLSCTEAAVWAVKQINARQDLLPNITLGYVVLNTCLRDLAALAQTLYIIPDTCSTTQAAGGGASQCNGSQKKFKVVGAVGPASSREAVLASSLLGVFHIPIVGCQASSDELSDKSTFEYALRVVPPDRYQVVAIVDFLEIMDWIYASIVYSEGSYGENAGKRTANIAKEKGICIELLQMVPALITEEGMTDILENLLAYKKARAVVIFLNEVHQDMLFRGVAADRFKGVFMWVSGDYMYGRNNGPGADGAFVVGFYNKPVPAFDSYYNSLQPVEDGSVWMKRFWQETYNCSWVRGANGEDSSCHKISRSNRNPFLSSGCVSLYIDAVYAHGFGLHSLISSVCPEAFKDKSLLESCVKGPTYLQYLKEITYEGMAGRIAFDEAGDVPGKYVLTQFFHDAETEFKPIALWDQLTDTFDIYYDDINWRVFRQTGIRDNGIPESVCSKPCKEKEYAVRLELICCWECRLCRENEILSQNSSGCTLCPEFFWPDDLTQKECEAIPEAYLTWTDTAIILLLVTMLVGIILCLISCFWIFKYWSNQLVKASSRGLSLFILTGCLLAFLSALAIISPPQDMTCAMSRIGFGVSVSIIYSPLLVKTNRVYRIFQAGQKGNARPVFISNRAQMWFTLILVIFQVRGI